MAAKKKVKKKIKFSKPFYVLISGIGFIIPLIVAYFLLSKPQIKQSFNFSASPITYLIATISAQKENIKIDPQFSYQEEQIQRQSPVRIVIPSIKIDTSIVDAKIIDGYWETATNSASFGLGSAYPAQVGNTVIFAHARYGLFANLPYIQKGDKIYVLTKTSWIDFEVKEIKSVRPNQVEVISPTTDKILTLYTCSGANDFYRFVVVAKPISK